jgi:ATP-binding cassette subfamily B protein
VVEALIRVSAGRTTLVVTHDPKLAERFDRVVFIEDGRIVEDGTPSMLLRRYRSRFARMHATQTYPPAARSEDARSEDTHDADAA